MTTPSPDTLTTLDDRDAIRILALIADHTTPLPDPTHLRNLENQLRQALTNHPTTNTTPISGGDLARATLAHLATNPDHTTTITHAIQLPHDRDRDLATLAIGGLILLALKTELEITRTEDGHWRLHLHKKATNDTTLTTLITKIATYFHHPNP